jgi:hypothetical protein
MSIDFDVFLTASPNDRRNAFVGTSRRLCTAAQNTDKDLRACWTIGHTRDGATVPFSAALLDSRDSPVLAQVRSERPFVHSLPTQGFRD